MPNPFPAITLDYQNLDANPAVRLFGRRFFSDQTTLEFLIEMLLVGISPKKVEGTSFQSFLPPLDLLKTEWTHTLDYAPRACLNLKLFSFFGASKLDSRHQTHRNHLEQLDEQLKARMSVTDDTSENVLKTLENLFLGFHGVGMQRTWCAQSFMPVCRNMLACESIWKISKAKNIEDWNEALRLFSHKQWLFLARGGELLYLQLCNALRRNRYEIENWLKENQLDSFLTTEEKMPDRLHSELEKEFNDILKEAPATMSRLAEFIDREVDKDTEHDTDYEHGLRRYTSSTWCAEETWQESYLFAVELLRICRANLDLMDRIELLETACSMQVIRTLTTQAARYSNNNKIIKWPASYLAVSDLEGNNQTVKQVSRATVQTVCKLIYDGLRHPEILEKTPNNLRDKLYPEADRRYGHKLFINLGKRIGLIVPRRGAGIRIVLNGQLMRFLIIALSPGRRMTYETFKLAAEAHFGLVFDEVSLSKANTWATGVNTESFGGATDDWLLKMLEEAGALRRLSDSCALVENTAAPENKEARL